MKINYHTHTTRCHHAAGTEREYVEAAIANGIKVLGFADHTPYPFPEDHSHGIRMRMHELDDYVNTVLSLKEEYKDQIEIHLGLEVEYFPQYFEQLRRELANYPIEYFLLAQHLLGNSAPGEFYCGRATDDPAKLTQYCDQVLAGMETGCFTYLAHPDLFNFVGEKSAYHAQMRRLCQAANQTGTPLELNLLGIRADRHYPNKAFWEAAAEENCPVVIGIDAHSPEEVLNTTAEVTAMEIISEYGLQVLETIPLRNI